VQALRWRRPSVALLGLEEKTHGMADDLIATGFEADTKLQSIEIAVECFAQGNGNSDGQHASGCITFRTSSSHKGLHMFELSEERRLEINESNYLFYTIDIFCKHNSIRESSTTAFCFRKEDARRIGSEQETSFGKAETIGIRHNLDGIDQGTA